MTESLPEPPICAEVDLRGLEYMPFFGNHLFGSEFNAICSDNEWRAGVTLWWAAWNQVPAGSLPNDDAALTRLADMGRDLKAFRKVKIKALRGFSVCSDGRLYHSFLCKQALVAWEKRVKEREKKRKWREENERKKQGQEPGHTQGQEKGQNRDRNRDTAGDGTADVNRRDVTGRDDGKPKPTSSTSTSTTETGAATESAALPKAFDGNSKAATLAAALRNQGIAANGAHPSVQEWAEIGYTPAEIAEAAAQARTTLGKNPSSPAYLTPILAEIRTPPKRGEPAWWSTEKGIVAKGREFGLEPKAGEDWNGFKGRIQAAIAASKGGQGQIEKMLAQQRSEAA